MKWKVLLVIILIVGCEYKPDGENFVEIIPVSFGDIVMNLLDQEDTIRLKGQTTFTYHIKTQEKQQIYSLKIFIDGKSIIDYPESSGSFIMVPGDYEDGMHRVNMEIYTSSGTGSLADVVGAEALYYSHEWIVWVDKTPPVQLEITSITDYGGKLKIEWVKNSHANFQQYQVYRNLHYVDNNFILPLTGIEFIFHPDSNYFIDDFYIGGFVMYQIDNTASGITAEGIPLTYERPYPRFREVSYNGDSITFRWSKVLYPGNFYKYQLSYQTLDNVFFSTENCQDTSASHALFSGDETLVYLTTYSRAFFVNQPERLFDTITVYAGDKIKKLGFLNRSNPTGTVYLVNDGKIVNQ